MQVKIANRLYSLNNKEYQGVLNIAKEQVPFGIYAIERNGYVELRNDVCISMGQLKDLTRQFKSKGFKVLSNRAL